MHTRSIIISQNFNKKQLLWLPIIVINRKYTERCQTSRMELFAKILTAESCYLLLQNGLSHMFASVLNTPMSTHTVTLIKSY